MWWYLCCFKKKDKKNKKNVHFEDVTNPLMENDNLSRATTIDNNYPTIVN